MYQQTSILIVEDDGVLAQGLKRALKTEDREIKICGKLREARGILRDGLPDLMILDVNLPDGNGFDFLEEVKRQWRFPVILLTANDMETDIVAGLEAGADDYITKPFNPLELVARVKTQLRRCTRYNNGSDKAPEQLEEFDFRGLCITKGNHKCTLYGEELSLTPIEFSILWYLCERRGSVVSSEELFEAVWGEKFMDSNNTVMTHIARLREKMHEPSRKPKFVKTVWGVGYTIE